MVVPLLTGWRGLLAAMLSGINSIFIRTNECIDDEFEERDFMGFKAYQSGKLSSKSLVPALKRR